MARARNIKPAFFTNELLGTMDPMICLTFVGLWCLADKMGILEDRPLRIKAELFPYRDSLDVNGYLTVLAREGFIVRYENEGKDLIQVCNFRKHQSPHHTEKAKGFPFPNDPKSLIKKDNRYETVTSPSNDGECKVPERSDSLIPDSLIPDSLIPDSAITVMEPVQAPDSHEQTFERFWSCYPVKKSKEPSKKAWMRIKPTGELLQKIMQSLAEHCASRDWLKDSGQFVPHASTWLNQKRWEDEVGHVPPSRHSGFDQRDYTDGLTPRDDGSFGF